VNLLPTVRALQEQHAGQLSGELLSSLILITQIEATALRNARSLRLVDRGAVTVTLGSCSSGMIYL
jgi:hypothetical protein